MKRNILIFLGVLDIISFVRTYSFGLKLIKDIASLNVLDILEVILIISLILSGTLSLLRKKMSLIVYYIQFPFRIGFMIFTFGFLLEIFGFRYDAVMYKVMVVLIIVLELLRLVYSIFIQIKYYKR
jgi:hypothetical protein